jgi:2-iminobutanoate/2-iminopropanoate deaminase
MGLFSSPVNSPWTPVSGNIIGETIESQTEQVLKNLTAILKAAGSNWENVVKTTVFLKDVNHFARMNEIYLGALKGVPPARTTVEVARLPRDAMIEIDAIASVNDPGLFLGNRVLPIFPQQ